MQALDVLFGSFESLKKQIKPNLLNKNNSINKWRYVIDGVFKNSLTMPPIMAKAKPSERNLLSLHQTKKLRLSIRNTRIMK